MTTEPDQAADYGHAVNAPLSEETIAALGARLAKGDYPVRKVHTTSGPSLDLLTTTDDTREDS